MHICFVLCPLSSNPITLANTEAFFFFYVKKRLLHCSFGTNILYFSLPVVHFACRKDPLIAAKVSLHGVGNLVLACHQSIPSIDILLILALPNDPHTFPDSNFLKAKCRTILSCLQDLGGALNDISDVKIAKDTFFYSDSYIVT